MGIYLIQELNAGNGGNIKWRRLFMKYLFRVSVVLMGLIALFGCDQFFGANMFGSIDEPDPVAIGNLVEKLDETNAEGGIANLNNAVENDTFFNDLIADAASAELAGEETSQITEILAFLDTQFVDVVVTDENRDSVQDSALLAAAVNIETTSAAATIDNVTDLIVAATADEDSEDAISFDSTEDVVETIIPENATPPEGALIGSPEADEAKEEFIALIDSLSLASDAFSAFGSALIVEDVLDEDGNPVLDEDGNQETEVTAPDDVNMGETAQSAIVAVMVDTVIDNIVDNNTLGEGVDPAEVLFEIVFFPDTTTYTDVDIWTPVPEFEDDGVTPIYEEDGVTQATNDNPMDVAFSDPGVENILAASGFLDLLEGMFSGGDEDTDTGDPQI
jgi:hypothetical protein